MSSHNEKHENTGRAPHILGCLASIGYFTSIGCHAHACVGMLRRVLDGWGLWNLKLQPARQPVVVPPTACPRKRGHGTQYDDTQYDDTRYDDNRYDGTRGGFTLVELLVVISIISILAVAAMAGLSKAREAAKRRKTEATIAKLNDIIMRRYESYLTRRVPVDLRVFKNPQTARQDANKARLDGIRDLMRMEMPERFNDITQPPVALPNRSALAELYGAIYQAKQPTPEFGPAECLYLIVNCGNADDRAMFNRNEIDDLDEDGWPEFVDGWGRPIYFLRWAPGFVESEIQSGDAQIDHDPFDTYNIDPGAFQLYPLIYSAGGGAKEPALELSANHSYDGNPYNMSIGAPAGENAGMTHIHNHHSSLMK